jgi:hypothetical protein
MTDGNSNECIAHPIQTDPDCEYCMAEVAALTKLYESKVQSNNAKVQSLATTGVQLDPKGVITMRLNLFISMLMGDGNRNRMNFEIKFQDLLHQTIENVQKQVRQQQLLQGVKMPGPQRPMRPR